MKTPPLRRRSPKPPHRPRRRRDPLRRRPCVRLPRRRCDQPLRRQATRHLPPANRREDPGPLLSSGPWFRHNVPRRRRRRQRRLRNPHRPGDKAKTLWSRLRKKWRACSAGQKRNKKTQGAGITGALQVCGLLSQIEKPRRLTLINRHGKPSRGARDVPALQ